MAQASAEGLSPSKRALLRQRLESAARLRDEVPGRDRPAPDRAIPGQAVPLSRPQQRFWVQAQRRPDSPVNNVAHAWHLDGDLDHAALELALRDLLRRHEVLRVRFASHDGTPTQVLTDATATALAITDLQDLPEPERTRRCRTMVERDARRPFDLARPPMMRAHLCRLGPRAHVLVLVWPHIVTDAWSVGILQRDLAVLYRAARRGEAADLPNPPVGYLDFAARDAAGPDAAARRDRLTYWTGRLRDAPPLDLPTDFARPATPSERGDSLVFTLPSTLVARLEALGRGAGATLFMVLLAAFKVLLLRHSGQSDITVGTPTAGRRTPALEALVGPLINTLALRSDLGGGPSFRQALDRVRDGALEAYEHQDLPFDLLVPHLRRQGADGDDLPFSVLFALEQVKTRAPQLEGLAAKPLTIAATATAFDLTVELEAAEDGLHGLLQYRSELFERATAERLVGHYRTLLEAAVEDPGAAIDRLPLMPAPERRRLLQDWSGRTTAYPRDDSVHGLFARRAAAWPQATALVAGGDTVSYGRLDAAAEVLAARLRARGVGPGQRIAVCLPRAPSMVTALLAVLKAGAAYLPLDADDPPERLAFMLADSGAALLLSDSALAARLPAEIPRLLLDAAPDEAEAAAPNAPSGPPPPVAADDPAYVIYTSGSTGRPKGVVVPHRAILRLACSADYVDLSPAETLLQASPASFDAATFEIWGALLNGARLVVPPPQTLDLAALGGLIAAHGVTTLFLTTSLFNLVVDEDPGLLRGLRTLLFGGEATSLPHLRRAVAALPGCRIVNCYGPTENTTFTTVQPVDHIEARRPLPIGRPIANTTVHILDPQNQPVPPSVAGELCCGGDGLALGYLDRPELTAERFVELPGATVGRDDGTAVRLYRSGDAARWRNDGSIEFLGRLDRQVKLRGFRIEPAEIEAVLHEHPAVARAAVVVERPADGPARLTAHVEGRPGLDWSAAALRRHLAARLPGYMIPAGFVAVDALPLTPSGKVDAAALARPRSPASSETPPGEAPRDAMEAAVLRLFQQVLDQRPIAVEDNFFCLGGDSLSALKLLARAGRAFDRSPDLAGFLQQPTARGLAGLLRQPAAAPLPPGIEPLRLSGNRPPLVFAYGVNGSSAYARDLLPGLPDDRPVYGLRSSDLDEDSATPGSLREMAADSLRVLRKIQPTGPYHLAGYSFGGHLAVEMAAQLEAAGETVAFLAVLDTPAGFLRALPEDRQPAMRWPSGATIRRAALAAHVPTPVAGRVRFLCSSPTSVERYLLPDGGWGELAAQGVEVHRLTCSHDDLLGRQEAAWQLGAWLATASDGDSQGPSAEPDVGGQRQATLLAAWRHQADGDPRGALTCYARLLADGGPQPAWIHYAHGRLALRLGDTAALDRLRAQTPSGTVEDARLSLALALLAENRGEWSDARGHLARAARLDRDQPLIAHHLSVVDERLGDLDSAEAAARRAIAADGAIPAFHLQLGKLLLRRDALAEAESELRRALSLSSGTAEAHHHLAQLLDVGGRRDEAIAEARRACELMPWRASLHHGLGVMLARARRWPEAEDSHRAALRLRPDMPEARWHLAIALYRQGRAAAATTLLPLLAPRTLLHVLRWKLARLRKG